MMFINEEEERFEIKEFYSFNGEIADKVLVYQDIAKKEAKQEKDEEYKAKMLKFAEYELDHVDKVTILRYIKNSYEKIGEINDTLIELAIQDWIYDIFDISDVF